MYSLSSTPDLLSLIREWRRAIDRYAEFAPLFSDGDWTESSFYQQHAVFPAYSTGMRTALSVTQLLIKVLLHPCLITENGPAEPIRRAKVRLEHPRVVIPASRIARVDPTPLDSKSTLQASSS